MFIGLIGMSIVHINHIPRFNRIYGSSATAVLTEPSGFPSQSVLVVHSFDYYVVRLSQLRALDDIFAPVEDVFCTEINLNANNTKLFICIRQAYLASQPAMFRECFERENYVVRNNECYALACVFIRFPKTIPQPQNPYAF